MLSTTYRFVMFLPENNRNIANLTKHIAEYQCELKASRADMVIACTSLDVNEKVAAAKPKGKKKIQTGKQGYADVERHIGNGGGTRGIAYVDYDDYDEFM
ncbi:hypothetical protein PsorP6_006154 [Peronosclerospora sorghi]|uniref:Uncharacterized protein n=1 Tax=Peronosclerospora sorghi TaxID=230839 RepID=A0ACC0W5S7_9STRA|nr:hypothetical protein PsorP6_006154 [Peronosclerospora sorghi]